MERDEVHMLIGLLAFGLFTYSVRSCELERRRIDAVGNCYAYENKIDSCKDLEKLLGMDK